MNFKPNEILLFIIAFTVWIYLLTVLRRNKLTAFHFMLGSTGLFTFVFLMLKKPLTYFCSIILMNVLALLSHVFSFYEVYKDYFILFINNKDANISMLIDYECCGVIEILVVLSIVIFFPLFDVKKKIIYSFIGFVYVVAANVLRLLIICFVIYVHGNNSYYIAHSLVGRIIFYILTVVLYFYMISRNQIGHQKVGNFEYGD